MIFTVVQSYPYWITFLVAIPASFLHIRIFILFHDCCHGSLFPNQKTNIFFGYLTGILTYTPFESWKRSHLKHHATNSQLDHRGVGDVWTMTVGEYTEASSWLKLRYRLFRNPLVMFLIGPVYIFIFKYRFSTKGAVWKERKSTIITNIGLLAILVGVSLIVGFVPFILMLLPVTVFAGMMGIWLFYVQHQFAPGYWAHDEEWSELDAALKGASFYNLPRLFQWLFANIGIHHIHHLLPRIPNYRLRRCYSENPEVHIAQPLTIGKSLRSLRMKLWDEPSGEFLSFRAVRRQLGT